MKFFYTKTMLIVGCLFNYLLLGSMHKELLVRKLAAQHPQFKRATMAIPRSIPENGKPIERTVSNRKIEIVKN